MVEAILTTVVGIASAVLGYLGVRYANRDRKPPPAPPAQSSPADRALDDIFTRLERVEVAHGDLLERNAKLREENARLRSEIRQCKAEHITDAETIRTLRRRVDDLVRMLDERD